MSDQDHSVQRPQVSKLYAEGMIAGVIGAATVAIWFLVLDTINGRPLYTPTVLGMALLQGSRELSLSQPVPIFLEITLMFTWVHFLAFVIIGGVAARLLGLAEHNPDWGFGILLLFVILEFGFVAVAFVFAQPILEALTWPAVLVGNLLAAASMACYFYYRHRDLRILP